MKKITVTTENIDLLQQKKYEDADDLFIEHNILTK